jgi:sugar lactone lactonase YvrE
MIRKVSPAGAVVTLAGSPGIAGEGSLDGTGPAASFYSPHGIAVDGAGNIYVADSANSTIRKVTQAGVVTTLAGAAGQNGSADGTGSAARFTVPYAIATDASGNIFVADSFADTIRKVTPAGVVTTIAGLALTSGSTDGAGAAARFNFPTGIAVDSAGNAYVADTYNQTIRKISPAGDVTTLAGTPGASGSADGIGAAARFHNPCGAATDTWGNVYVADCGNNMIRKVAADGTVSTIAGTLGQSSFQAGGLPSVLNGASALAVQGSTLFIANTNENSIAIVGYVP